MNDETRIDLDGGKYTVILNDNEFKALRYHDTWRDLTGDKLVLNMLFRIVELEHELHEIKMKELHASALAIGGGGRNSIADKEASDIFDKQMSKP